jgi:ABC-type transporter Mla subunit MlaD
VGQSNRRNTILAGAFVVASLLLAVWVSFMLSDSRGTARMREISVRFPLAMGTHGLQKGSPVLMGGQQVGTVADWRFDFETDGQGRDIAQGVIVLASIDQSLTIFSDAKVFLERPLLGTLSSLNIVDVGGDLPADPAKAPAGVLAEGGVLVGTLAPPALLAQAGYGEEQAHQVRTLIKDLADMVATTKPNVEGTTADAREVLTLLRQRVGEWSTKVDTTLANVETASAKINPLMDTAKATLDEFSVAATNARLAVEDVRAAIDENRPKIDSILTSVDQTTQRVNRESVDLLNGALADARDALRVLSDAADGAQRLLTRETPTARRILANLRLMSDQLKLTAVEVRSQPWRLLYQPTRKESDEQLLYDSVRSYAEASSDLRAAADSLKALTADRAGVDPNEVRNATQAVDNALENYTQAERAFLNRLLQNEQGIKATSPKPRSGAAPSVNSDDED